MNEKIEETIKRIEYYDGKFPKEDLQFLLDNQAEVTPFLLEAIRHPEEVFDKILNNEKDYFLPFYALFMLAQFREPQAYPLVYELFSADGDEIDDALGDFVTGDLQRVLASVSGGDTTLIDRLVEDDNVYEYVRTAALNSWLCLLRAGLKTREDVISYYKSLFEKPWEEESFVCGSLAWGCLDLKAVELLPEIEKSYTENKIELMLMGAFDEFQRQMAEEKSRFLDGSDKNFDLVDDMISDLEQWHCFSNPQEYMREISEPAMPKPLPNFEAKQNLVWESEYDGTFVRDVPKVGKNEPCPCGSGRKYKKCCMN